MTVQLNTNLNLQCSHFAIKYNYSWGSSSECEIKIDPTDAVGTLLSLAFAVKTRVEKGIGKPLYVFIDEYDRYAYSLLTMGSLRTPPSDSLNQNIRVLTDELPGATTQSSVELIGVGEPAKRVITTLKLMQGTGQLDRLFLAGLSRLSVVDPTTSNFIRITSAEEELGACLGFNVQTLRRGLDGLSLSEAERREALALFKEFFDGYRFPGVGVEEDGLFTPQLCLRFLQTLCKKSARVVLDPSHKKYWNNSLSGMPEEELLEQIEDYHSRVSSKVLAMIAKAPYGEAQVRLLQNGQTLPLSSGSLCGSYDLRDLLHPTTELAGAAAVRSFLYDQGLTTLGDTGTRNPNRAIFNKLQKGMKDELLAQRSQAVDIILPALSHYPL